MNYDSLKSRRQSYCHLDRLDDWRTYVDAVADVRAESRGTVDGFLVVIAVFRLYRDRKC